VQDWFKRCFDVFAAVALLVVLSPLLATVALIVRARLGRPVMFRQRRPGLHEELFTIIKFRTMTGAPDDRGNRLPDEVRLTRLGRWLRRTSIDELPELWNVLRGDMSLVGPRPLLVEYLPRYNREQRRRHDVRPGITGWTQVNGRNALTWDDKFRLDVWYVDHRSFWLDLRILARTIGTVIGARGVSQPGSATTEPFLGDSPTRDRSAAPRGRS
jgi:sugar transferase EpsL